MIPYNEWLFESDRIKVWVSNYSGWNEDIIKKYKNKIYEFLQPRKNINVNPNFDEVEAKEIRKNCYFNVRLVGKKLYNCCLSEPIEREYKTESVHILFDKHWKEKIHKIPTWNACRYCFQALSVWERI